MKENIPIVMMKRNPINKKRELSDIVLGLLGTLLALYGLTVFNQHTLMTLSLGVRMMAMILTYWLVAIVPIIIMLIRKENLFDYGFTKDNICQQILVGILVGIAFSVVLTLIPHILKLGNLVDSGKRYTHLWQFAYEFLYCIFAVGLVEEFLFRGFFYAKIKRISNDTTALFSSSVLFGLFHLFVGNVFQMVITIFLGAVWCLCRNKIKYCSTLSLVIAHGIYDALITVWGSILLQ